MIAIKDVYEQQELIQIGVAVMEYAKDQGPDMYFHGITNEDAWFDICLETFPEKAEQLTDWVSRTESKFLPGEELGEIFYRAEQVVFGATIAEYKAGPWDGVLFSGFCAIRQAMHRATLVKEGAL